jgi:hypothetical protein
MSLIPRRLLPLLPCTTAFALLLGGCLHVYTSQTYTVTVLDGDTRRPVPNARVELGYLRSEMDINNPSGAPAGTTDAQGQVAITGTTFAHFWTVKAEGDYVGNGSWKEPNPATSTTTSIQLEVYRLPKPSLTLVIPDGFHGAVLINPGGPGETLTFTPGQRQFTFRVPPSGRAVFLAPGIFHAEFGGPHFGADSVDDFDLKFVSSDGREIPAVPASFSGDKIVADPVPGSVGRAAYNAMNFEPNTHFATNRPVWVIGGPADAEAVARLLYIPHQNGLGREFNYRALDALFNSPDSAASRAQK